MKKLIFGILFPLFSISIFSQPFIDPLNFNTQQFHSTYNDSLHSKNVTTDYNLNLFLPKKFKNDNTLLIRLQSEKLQSAIEKSYGDVYSFSIPVGFQFVSKNKKWKSLFMAIPKINSDLKDNLSKDFQYGGTGLFTYVINDSLKIKLGVYYNRECFGNFIIPLVGIDWKVNRSMSVYGILPNNMRVEFNAKKKIFFGLGMKNYKRSYRLSAGFHNDFVLVKETQVKLFVEGFIWKKFLLFGDIAYSLKYDFGQFAETDLKMKTPILDHAIYSPMNNNFLFTAGIAYRIRTD